MKLKQDKLFAEEVSNHLKCTYNILEEQNIDTKEDKTDIKEYSEWIKTKTEIKYGLIKNDLFIFNYYIYWAYLGYNIGSEQSLCRPILVVRTTKESEFCTVIPLSLEHYDDEMPYHVDLENSKSTALVEQIRTISKKRIYSYHRKNGRYATISDNDWKNINQQLDELYRLKPLYEKLKKGIAK